MKIGAWIHDYDGMSLDEQIPLAVANGLRTLRSYHILYAEKMAPALHQAGMCLFADVSVDAETLARDWRSHLRSWHATTSWAFRWK
ncbi:MAG: hypothetical protein AVDCRST_MAG93-8328 [uncultured Chloroflexia bacterium]|uniref:Uncharacterized protein n=1 Tax=uncultured Chloroflexia bacterium TaxID=1672391 RepID=A0A6J4N110_9CHLR|nr:MAG: hypothetical protein AVDCRST_MAG93-8328 [uncultured Chloroflexia bacterium]